MAVPYQPVEPVIRLAPVVPAPFVPELSYGHDPYDDPAFTSPATLDIP